MPTVLIVDDDAWARGALERALLAEPRLAGVGVAVEIADGASAALAAFRRGRPDLAVIDLMLPDDPGDVLASALRREPDAGALPIAFTSSAAIDRTEADRLARVFGARHFGKPHGLEALAAHVARVLTGGDEETQAATTAPAAGDEELGDLATRRLPAVLFDLHEREATGRLALRRGQVAKEIVLVDGHPYAVTSNVRAETLGHYLVARRLIDAEQHGAAVARASESGRKFGQALVELGLLTPEQLLAELTGQARFKLERALRWPDGGWRFVPTGPTGATRGEPIDLVAAVFDGLRGSLSFDPLPPHLAVAAGRPFTLRARGIRLLAALGERCPGFVSRYSDGLTIEALEAAGADRVEVLVALDALLLTDAVGTGEAAATGRSSAAITAAPLSVDALGRARRPTGTLPPGVPRAVREEESGVIEIPVAMRERLDPASAAARQAVITEYLRVQFVDLYTVLEVEHDADGDTIEAAAFARRARFSRASFEGVSLGREHGKLEELEALYRRAETVLGDPAAREAYDRTLRPLDDAARAAPMAIELQVRAAEKAAAAGDVAGAIARLEEVCAQVPHEASYRATLAALVWQRAPGDPAVRAAAMAHADLALQLDPDLAAAHETRGRILAAAGDPAGAAHLLRALELDPAQPAVLDALERDLRGRGELAALDRCYRQLLYRLDQRDPAFAIDLWRRLAALQRDDLGDLDAAATALAAALALAPGDPTLRAALADVQSGASDRFHQRVLELRERIVAERDVGAGLALLRAADEAGKADLAFLVAAVLCAGETQPPDAFDRHERERPRFVRRAWAPLDDATWPRLLHPDDAPEMTALFAALEAPTRAAWPIRLDDIGVEGASDEASLPEPVVKTRDYLAQLLQLAPPAIAVHAPLGDGVAIAAVEAPLVLVGEGALKADRLELAFRLGRAMAYLLPGRALAGAYPGRMLKQVVLAAHLATQGQEPDPAAGPELAALVAAIWALDDEPRAAIAEALDAIVRQQRTLNLSHWTRALGWTADRVGLLACGDPTIALRIVERSGGADAARPLIDFALGPDFLALRTALGLSIDV